MNYVELNNGVLMPCLGYGVYKINDAAECERSVSEALEVGYRLVDTASFYQNEAAVGRALAASGIARQDLFVTSKAWPNQLGDELTKRAFSESLEKLGLDYLDLYLIHQPFGDIYGAWRTMEALLREGLVRAIGVSNFSSDRLQDLIIFNKVKPAVNQIECNVFYQQWEAERYLRSVNVAMEGWAPLARGEGDVFENPVLLRIANAHQKSVAQVILRWQIERGIICIPKTTSKVRMQENFDVFDFSLSAEEMDAIRSLDTHTSFFFDQRDPAQIAERIQA